MKPRPPLANGFTLTELLVVVALLAMVAAVALPRARRSGEAQELSATAQKIAAVLIDTRTAAMSGNRTAEVGVDFETRTVSGPAGSQAMLPLAMEVVVTTDRGLVGREGGDIRFYADGGSTGGKIVLRKGAEQREITINWLTGNVAITAIGSKP